MIGDAALDALNTLRLPSTAEYLWTPRSIDQVRSAVDSALQMGLPITVLGGGSNVVLRARLPGAVIAPRLTGISVERRADTTLVTAGAGVVWHDLVRYCIGQGLSGLENLALIPGHVGAAPIQNIGAYGVELDQVFHSLTVLSCRDATPATLRPEQCVFGYRDSVFKHALRNEWLITSVTFSLNARYSARTEYPDLRHEIARVGRTPSAANIAEAVIRIRRRKLPDVRSVPNVGSFFKNPVLSAARAAELHSRLDALPMYPDRNGMKVSAAFLIDAAGWKGRSMGQAGVWRRQPLVLVNRGGATAREVLRLSEAIRGDVLERFGVELEQEPIVMGLDE